MPSNEALKITFTGLALVAVVVLAGLGKLTPEFAVLLAVAIASPSGAPDLLARVRALFANKPPPPALVVVLGTAFALATAAISTACALLEPGKAPAAAAPCAKLTVDECAAMYQAELVACTTKSATLESSIDCENDARARYGRPLRAKPRRMYAADAGAAAPAPAPLTPDSATDDDDATPRSPIFEPPLVRQTSARSAS